MNTITMKSIAKKVSCVAMTLALIAGLAFGLSACNNKLSDWEYIQDQGVLKIGYTLFEPMNYKDANGVLTGFDTEFAQAVCKKLGVRAEFIELADWGSKVVEMKSKNIDCAWNGMTIKDDLRANMDISNPYMRNKQVCIIRKSDASKYTTIASMADATLGMEMSSAGQTAVENDPILSKCAPVILPVQTDVLLNLRSGNIQVGVIDYIMALASVGDGTNFSDLMIVEDISLAVEEYGIGFRKNSPNTLAKINQAIKELYADGTLTRLETKYNLTGSLMTQN